MTNSLIEIEKCACCDTHILSLDSSLLRLPDGLKDDEGNALTGLISIADLTPEECVSLGDKCHEAIRDWVGQL